MEGSLLMRRYNTSALMSTLEIHKKSDRLDLGLRDAICKLEERPWLRGREPVEPALLVAWLSTEVTEPIDTIETDLPWLLPLPFALPLLC